MGNIKRRVKKWLGKSRTQTWLAAELGVSDSYLSLIIAGRRRPSLSVAGRLEDVTGIPARDFDQPTQAPSPEPEQSLRRANVARRTLESRRQSPVRNQQGSH